MAYGSNVSWRAMLVPQPHGKPADLEASAEELLTSARAAVPKS